MKSWKESTSMVLKALVYNHRPVVGGGKNQVGIAPPDFA